MSTYLATAILKHTTSQEAYTMPTSIFLALYSSDPTDDGIHANEVADAGAYARIDITSLMAVAVSGYSQNTANITFPTATLDWGQITHTAVLDSSVIGAGNFLYSEALVDTFTVLDTEVFEYLVGNFSIELL